MLKIYTRGSFSMTASSRILIWSRLIVESKISEMAEIMSRNYVQEIMGRWLHCFWQEKQSHKKHLLYPRVEFAFCGCETLDVSKPVVRSISDIGQR